VHFDHGEVHDDISLDGAHTPVKVQYDGSWFRGRQVELIKGGVVWGVAFEDGDWAEDVQPGDSEVRYGSVVDWGGGYNQAEIPAAGGGGGLSYSGECRKQKAQVLDVRRVRIDKCIGKSCTDRVTP